MMVFMGRDIRISYKRSAFRAEFYQLQAGQGTDAITTFTPWNYTCITNATC